MNGRARTAVLTVALVLTLAGCTGFAFLFGETSSSPQEDMIGSWTIMMTSGPVDVSEFMTLVIRSNNTLSFINGDNETVEDNDITEITDSSFVGTITLQTSNPSLVGETTYAEYEVSELSGTRYLRVAFYEDSTKTTRFVTFTCEEFTK